MDLEGHGWAKLYRPFDKPQDEEQDHRADDSDDDRPDHSTANRYPQCTGKVATDDGTHDPNNDIDDEAKSAAFDDLTRHEASDRADHKPYDYAMFHRSDSPLLLDEFAAFQIVNEPYPPTDVLKRLAQPVRAPRRNSIQDRREASHQAYKVSVSGTSAHRPTTDVQKEDRSLPFGQAFISSVRHLAEQQHLDLTILHGDGTKPVAKKDGDGIDCSGHKHQTGEKIIAIVDNNGFVLAPLPVALVNEADTVLPPEGLSTLKRVAKPTGLKIDGTYLNLDGGFDSRRNRRAIFNAGLIPNIQENPRNRKTPKRGRKRLFNAAIHSLRLCLERTFAWEDKFKRLLLRFEFKR